MLDILHLANKSDYPSFEFLKQKFGYFLTQIIEDKEISDSEKIRCLETISTIPKSSVAEFKNNCDINFFHKNKLKGKLCKNLDELNPFIRVNDKDSLVLWITSLTGLKPVNVKHKLSEIIVANRIDRTLILNSFLNNFVINSSYQKEDNCLSYFGQKKWTSRFPPKLKDAHISYFKSIQWSFPNPTSENLFVDQHSVEKIKCRAGVMDKNKKIIFLHTLSSDFNVRKPTLFDAGFYKQFKPNGTTKPLGKCKSFSGFLEFVHIPNKFMNLQDTIFETFNS